MILGIDCSRFALPHPTGVEMYTDRIVEGLLRKADQLGFSEVRLYVRDSDQVEKLQALIKDTAQSTPKICLLAHRRFWTLWFLSRELWNHPIDMLFVPSHVIPLFTPKKILLTPHGVEGIIFPEAYSLFSRLHQRFFLWLAKIKGTKFIAVSKTVKADLMKFFKIPEAGITVIYHGFDPAPEQSTPKKPFVEGHYILSIGRLEIRKNQLRLVKAFESIAAEFPELRLVLVGSDGYGAEEVRSAIKQSPVEGRIILAGYQDREVVLDLMRNAKVFAYPSLVEGFGIPILEAFEAGVPVLSSKGSSPEEIGGDSAMYCDPLSVDSIAQGLKFYLLDEKLRQEKIRLGKKQLEQFSWKACIEKTQALIRNGIENFS